jgi:hypothetical protein
MAVVCNKAAPLLSCLAKGRSSFYRLLCDEAGSVEDDVPSGKKSVDSRSHEARDDEESTRGQDARTISSTNSSRAPVLSFLSCHNSAHAIDD